MAWGGSRATRRRLLLYSLSVVLGRSQRWLVSMRVFSGNVRQAIDIRGEGHARADLFVTAPAPLTAPVMDTWAR